MKKSPAKKNKCFCLLEFVLISALLFNSYEVKALSPDELDLSASEPHKIHMLQGETQSLLIPHAGVSIWVENGEILHLQEQGKSVLIKALKPGSSEVRLGSQSFEVNVLNLDQERTLKILEKTTQKTLGLQAVVKKGQVWIEGHLRRWKDWELLSKDCYALKCSYAWHAEVPDDIWTQAELHFNETLKSRALPQQRFEKYPLPSLHIFEKSSHLKEVENLMASYGVQIIKDNTVLELAPMVKVQITVAEVKRDHLLQYGMHWPSTYKAQIMPSLNGVTDPQFVTAEFWEQTGAGRILASPNLLCRSGKDAEFLAGGEFPIKIINFRLEDVIWKKYGILLKVSPQADFSGRMSIAITTEVSSIDPSRTVDGIPGLFTNRVQSYFDLAKPKTIALSGLIKSEDSKVNEGLPWLSQIPVLGSLFGSKDFRENRTELVIFVRPEVVSPDAPEEKIQTPELEQASL